MGRSPRINYKDAYFHVYNRGVNKMAIVHDEQDRRTFIKLLAEMASKYQVRIFAYCLMSNHYHLFIQTREKNLSNALWYLSINYARYFNVRHDRVGPLYQGRFRSRLVDEHTYCLSLIRYIHQNPVEAGIANSPQDYFWSSYPCYTGILPKWDWLDADWVLGLFARDPKLAQESFEAFHSERPNHEMANKLSNIRKKLC